LILMQLNIVFSRHTTTTLVVLETRYYIYIV
jgi:hypothetical protein